MSSFHGLFGGKTCIAAQIALASGVLKRTGVVNCGSGGSLRPSWLMPLPKMGGGGVAGVVVFGVLSAGVAGAAGAGFAGAGLGESNIYERTRSILDKEV